jgi:hypothetical protein
MAATPMSTKNKHQKLVYRVDEYASTLINEAELLKNELSIEQKISLLNSLGKWVAIKNKLIDALEGEKLADFRTRLKQGSSHALGDVLGRAEPTGGGQSSQRVDYEQKARAGRRGMISRWGLSPDPESFDGPSEQLAAFKKRIPRADDGRND